MPLGPASRVPSLCPPSAASAPAPFSHLHPAQPPPRLSPRPSGWHTSRCSAHQFAPAHGRQWHAPSLHPKAWDRHGHGPGAPRGGPESRALVIPCSPPHTRPQLHPLTSRQLHRTLPYSHTRTYSHEHTAPPQNPRSYAVAIDPPLSHLAIDPPLPHLAINPPLSHLPPSAPAPSSPCNPNPNPIPNPNPNPIPNPNSITLTL